MTHRCLPILPRAVSVFFTAISICLPAASAEHSFFAEANTITDEMVAAAVASPEPGDNISLAGQIIQQARNAYDPAKIDKYCDDIIRLTAEQKDGYALASHAAELRAARVPGKRKKAVATACALRKKIFEANSNEKTGVDLIRVLMQSSRYSLLDKDIDSAKAALEEARAVAKGIDSQTLQKLIRGQIDTLSSYRDAAKALDADLISLKAKPDNTPLRVGVIMKYILFFDTPGIAADFLNYSVEEPLLSMLPLVVKGPESLPAPAAEESYLWYKSLIAKAPAYARSCLLFRERQYIKRFLDTYPKEDKRKTAASTELASVEKRLAGAAAAAASSPVLWALDVNSLSIVADNDIRTAIAKSQKYLLSKQSDDGSWTAEKTGGVYDTEATTAVVTSALLESGNGPGDPNIRKALARMAAAPSNTLGTAALSWRCYAWSLAEGMAEGKYTEQLQKDASELYKAKEADGSFSGKGPEDESFYTFHATLGLAMATSRNFKVSPFVWLKIIMWWKNKQKTFLSSDGGGSAHRDATSCATSMLIARAFMGKDITRKKAMDYSNLQPSLQWVDKHFDNGKNDKALHYLYNLSRLGVARGTTTFGKKNWFSWAKGSLLKHQTENGSWKTGTAPPNIGTALGLMVLNLARVGR